MRITRKRVDEQTGYVLQLLSLMVVFTIVSLILKITWYRLLYLSLTYGIEFKALTGSIFALRSIISVLAFLSLVFLIFYFLRWFSLTYRYLRSQDNLYYLSHSPASAYWSWFIPVLNLFLPFMIMREIWESLKEMAGIPGEDPEGSRLVSWWWALIILSGVAGIFFHPPLRDLLSGDEWAALAGWKSYLVLSIIRLGSLAVSIVLFRKLKRYTQRLNAM